ncbi:diacylglycerol kinase family protein [Dongia sp.]|uniref:diacylglycerol/lipid kinase family protein n=1 Tax=Dongia sp. TaxID=1977262 RepID=UPI0035B34687
MPPRIAIIFNPIAGRSRRQMLEDVCDRLGARGWAIDLKPTGARGDAERMAREVAELPEDLRPDQLAVAGGDGTIGEAINGLITANGTVPLSIVPMGTANVLAAEIGLDVTPEAIAAAIDARRSQAIHVGRANGRAFTLMAGVGVDAHVVAELDIALKRRIGKGAYIWGAVKQLFRFGFPTYNVAIDGGRPIAAASIVVAKGRFYGGRHLVAPKADLTRPSFQICLFERKGALHMLRYALALGLGRLPKARGYSILEGRQVAITGPKNDPVQGDGDVLGYLPANIDIAPAPVQLVMPFRQRNSTMPPAHRAE